MGYLTRFVLRLMNPRKSSVAEAVKNREQILSLIGNLKREALASANASLVLIGFSVFFLIASSHGEGGEAERRRRHLYALLGVSLIFFLLGILCPVLTAVVKGQQMLIGGFIIQASSKGIVSTVVTLLQSGNWIIGALLFSFSIGIPIFKGIAALWASLSQSDRKRRQVARVLEAVGKWALTDVLVAAVLLACFSLNAVQQSNGGIVAVPRFAFGFFVLYCILAARTSYVLKRADRTGPAPSPGAIRGSALTLAGSLAAGGLFGFFIFENFSLARAAGNLAVVKIVRTHADLLSDKFSVSRGHPEIVPFEVPYAGTLNVEVKASGSTPLEISLVRDDSAENDPAKAAEAAALPDWQAASAKTYERHGRVEAGKYDLVVRDRSTGEGLIGGPRFTVQISLEP